MRIYSALYIFNINFKIVGDIMKKNKALIFFAVAALGLPAAMSIGTYLNNNNNDIEYHEAHAEGHSHDTALTPANFAADWTMADGAHYYLQYDVSVSSSVTITVTGTSYFCFNGNAW